VVKSNLRKSSASPPHMDDSVVFARWRYVHPLRLIHASLGPPESITQTTSRSVKPFLRAHYCDRQTDRPRYNIGAYSVCNNRPHLYVLRTAIRSNKQKKNIREAKCKPEPTANIRLCVPIIVDNCRTQHSTEQR